ncbi:outer membrane protein assembly factor BamB family protein [Methanobrevibacter arboriphilus]|uniref:outer membrane protein assembly factor BamB family protein n=1 Tax=Methanobrevibacter arboriphilus TaxID=39441 RepID=UPI000A97FC10|nr:PQQ-binding-like beta-propeller repeat protein [Methanobrevibacter arboriphilus]
MEKNYYINIINGRGNGTYYANKTGIINYTAKFESYGYNSQTYKGYFNIVNSNVTNEENPFQQPTIDSDVIKWFYRIYIIGSPVVNGNIIYANAYNGTVYAFNRDGQIIFTYDTGSYLINSPTIGKSGTIYVVSWDNKLHALKPDGTLKWIFDAGDSNFGVSPITDENEIIYFTSQNGTLFAVNPNGTLKWKYQLHESYIYNYSSNYVEFRSGNMAIGPDGTVYVINNYREGNNNIFKTTLLAINNNGTFKWEYQLEQKYSIASYNTPIVGKDGIIYLTANDGSDKKRRMFSICNNFSWNFKMEMEF